MRVSRRAGLRLVLILAVVALVWVRFTSLQHLGKPPAKRIPDLAASNPLNQAGGGPAPAEAYEVYSALYQAEMNEPLAFAENSKTDIPQVGRSCLKPTTPDEQDMADAFAAANRQSHLWQAKFSIPQGYRLLSSNQTARALTCLATHMHDAGQCAGYKQLQHVRSLGVPGFNREHTRALVSVIKSCGGFCGSGGIFEVEKAGSTWRRAAATDFIRNCSWMY